MRPQTPEKKSLRARRRRPRRARGDRRGVALIMVLGAITVLTVFLTDLQEETSSDLAAALSARDSLKAEYHARSGINLARLLIATEPVIKNAIAPIFMMMQKAPPQIPVWEFSDMVLGPFNDPSGAAAFGSIAGVDTSTGKSLGLKGGRFDLTIVDEDAKINVNTAAKPDVMSQGRVAAQLISLMGPVQYNPLFEGRDPDNQFSDRPIICGALIDWADPDEMQNPCDPRAQGPVASGVEDNFYQMVGLGYRRKNAAYDSLEEMRLVRGVGDDFWATFVDPDSSNPRKRILTVWGQGAVNVNTANPQTLLAIVCAGAPNSQLCIDPMQMQSFIMGVTMAKGFTMGAPVFGSPKDFVSAMEGKGMIGPMLAALGVQPVVFQSRAEMAKSVSTESKMFSIYSEGVVPGNKRETRVRIHAVVDFRTATALSGGGLGMGPDGQPASASASGGMPPGGMNPGMMGPGGMPGGMMPGGMPGGMMPPNGMMPGQPSPAGNVVYFRVD